jgi:aspartyl-tRNA(Asn)/glutamyl-tRNA(Gln) amidotransferase subunit A
LDLPESIESAAKALRERSATCSSLVRASLDRIAALQPELNAFLTTTAEPALARAAELDRELAAGRDRGPLHGIPVAIKDCFDTAGVRTTQGARYFEKNVAEADASAVARLSDAGAVMVGKTNMNELAAGTSGKNLRFGDVRNPWSPEHSPGGSSSGSAAAVASGMVLAALGTDTGGSVRVPAACTGVVGLRPTFGRVPIKGVYPRAESFDVAAPLARNVPDCAVVLGVLTGEKYQIDQGIAGLRVGLLEDFCGLADHFRSLGAKVGEVKVPLDYAHLVEIMLYEFNRALGAQFRACPNPDEMFGPVVCANLRRGPQISDADYARALAERERQSAAIRAIFGDVDALVTPVLPAPTPRLDAPAQEFDRQRQFMIPFSGAGVPAISLPCGMREGLPIGMQIVADRGREPLLFRIARAYESIGGWHTMPWRKNSGGGAAS